MEQKRPDEMLQLSVDEIIGLLDSPREDVSSHVHDLIKNELARVTNRWLITGLLEQFFQSKSKQLLNLILGSPEQHWKFLMDKVQEGLKGNDKFRYTSLLLYAVSANPPFPWVKKLPDHQIMREIFLIINPCIEKDVSVVVSGLMFLVVLLPTVPNDMSAHLTKMLDLFWMLMQHTPTNNALKVYLQISVFAFFQRLYALYPCRLIGFLRYHSEAKSLYEKTLFPMLEKVRLHPLLLTETRDSEIRKDRWKGRDRHELIQECAQISLDSFIDIPEGMSYSSHFRSKSATDRLTVDLGNYLSVKTESRIWSPGVMMSPARSSTNVTPVYSSQFSRTMSRSSIPESPLETAEEAISQTTTPCDSPFPAGLSSKDDNKSLGAKAKFFNPTVKDTAPNQNVPTTINTNVLKQEITDFKDNKGENFFGNVPADQMQSSDSIDIDHQAKCGGDGEPHRKRKQSVYNKDFGQKDSKGTSIDTIAEELMDSNEFSRQSSCGSVASEDGDDEGLGAPAQGSWSELMKTVNTKRLRFLSQCGPPPNLSKCTTISGSLTRSEPQAIHRPLRRSQSFPNVADDVCSSISSSIGKKDITPTLSPSKIEGQEASTQTEEAAVLDPYEQLLEALQGAHASPNPKNVEENSFDMLVCLMESIPNGVTCSGVELDWVNLGEGTQDHVKQQLRCLYALLKVEKFKKEVYAERNKRLFSKIKHCYYLSERQKSVDIELKSLTDEVTFLRNHHITLKNKIASQGQQINNMAPLSSLKEAEAVCDASRIEKQYLKELCKSLASEKSSLQEQLRCSEGRLEEAKRKMTICAQHSERNEALKSQLHSHQKQILLMGEIHRELDSQLSAHRNPDNFVPIARYEEVMDKMEDERSQLQYESREKKIKLKAAMLRIAQLEQQLEKKDEQIAGHQEDMSNLEEEWQEKYHALSKHNLLADPGVVNGFKDVADVRDSNDADNRSQRRAADNLRIELGPFLRAREARHYKPHGEQ